jgi:hypothetical protein
MMIPEITELVNFSASPLLGEQVARTAAFAVRVFSVAIMSTALYGRAVSKLRRPFVRIDTSSPPCACLV